MNFNTKNVMLQRSHVSIYFTSNTLHLLISIVTLQKCAFLQKKANLRRGGGTGGARGAMAPPPPQNLSRWAKVCFGPPKILTTGPPPPPKNWWPVVKIFAKLLLSTLKCAKIFRLRQANMGKIFFLQVISCCLERILLPCNIR